jgi:hypothetical protein
MLYPQFDTKVKDNARKKLHKIIEIKLWHIFYTKFKYCVIINYY